MFNRFDQINTHKSLVRILQFYLNIDLFWFWYICKGLQKAPNSNASESFLKLMWDRHDWNNTRKIYLDVLYLWNICILDYIMIKFILNTLQKRYNLAFWIFIYLYNVFSFSIPITVNPAYRINWFYHITFQKQHIEIKPWMTRIRYSATIVAQAQRNDGSIKSNEINMDGSNMHDTHAPMHR